MSTITGLINSLASKKALTAIILVLAVAMATYHIVNTFIVVQGNTPHFITHLTFVLLIGFLIKFRDTSKIKHFLSLVCIPIVIIVMVYLYLNWDRLEGSFGFISDLDLTVGIGLVTLIFIATWLQWGIAVPIMIGIAIIYFAFGHLLTGFLYHPEFSAKYLISSLGMSLTTGIFSSLLSISANTIIYFMLFGAIMEAMGVMPGFIEMGKLVGRLLRGGPAYVAWLGSGAISTISGDATGNVAITGSFTIPAMKADGFHPDTAGAIECVCGAGGPITPPVMGAAGFIMAGFLGVPYFLIMQKAVVGAIVYYLCIFAGIFIYSYSRNMKRYVGTISGGVIARRLPIFAVGLTIIVAFLMQSYSVGYACTTAVFAVVALALILLPETRSLKNILNGLAKGAIWGTQIGVVLAIIGILATAVTGTGLGPKATVFLFSLTGGNLQISLLMIAILAIILGMGIPISAAYSLLAVMLLPGLKQLGVDAFACHFFALYYSVWSVLTPPYAPAAMVASRLSGGSFWATGWRCMQFMVIPFFYPFVIAMHPTMLNFPDIGWTEIGWAAITVVIAAMSASAMFNWFIYPLNRYTRSLAIIAAVGIAAYVLNLGYAFFIIGIIAIVIIVFVQLSRYIRSTKGRQSSPVAV